MLKLIRPIRPDIVTEEALKRVVEISRKRVDMELNIEPILNPVNEKKKLIKHEYYKII